MKATATPGPIQDAARAIRDGRLVVFPTETVYGLGADALDEHAVNRIYAAKGRPADNPLIVHLASVDLIAMVADRLPPLAATLLARFAPGPLTLVLPAHPDLPPAVTAGLDTVAVRIPRHPVARAFLEACGRPVAAPSANRSGEPSPTTLGMARASLMAGRGSAEDNELGARDRASAGGAGGEHDAAGRDAARREALRGIRFLDGGPCEVGLESTVASVTEREIVILRPGGISADDLRAAAPGVAVREAPGQGEHGPARSPGRMHRHYRPRAPVVVHDPARDDPGELATRLYAVRDRGAGPVGVIGVGEAVDAAAAAVRRWQETEPHGGRSAGGRARCAAERAVPTRRTGDGAPCAAEGAVLMRRAADVAGYARDLYRWFTELDAAGVRCIVAVMPADRGIGRAVRDRLERASGG